MTNHTKMFESCITCLVARIYVEDASTITELQTHFTLAYALSELKGKQSEIFNQGLASLYAEAILYEYLKGQSWWSLFIARKEFKEFRKAFKKLKKKTKYMLCKERKLFYETFYLYAGRLLEANSDNTIDNVAEMVMDMYSDYKEAAINRVGITLYNPNNRDSFFQYISENKGEFVMESLKLFLEVMESY